MAGSELVDILLFCALGAEKQNVPIIPVLFCALGAEKQNVPIIPVPIIPF